MPFQNHLPVIASVRTDGVGTTLTANLLRRWVKEHLGQVPEADASGKDDTPGGQPLPTLVPVTLSLPEAEPPGDIKIAIHRAQTMIEITWPVSQAASCAQWLREMLQ